jgi:DNA-binding transcriptional regulator YdaS (Cro superfamily)
MEQLREYLNGLTTDEQSRFCARCKTSIGYLRKAISVGQKIGESLAIEIDRESSGAVRCEDLRPDVDWAYLRGTNNNQEEI